MQKREILGVTRTVERRELRSVSFANHVDERARVNVRIALFCHLPLAAVLHSGLLKRVDYIERVQRHTL